MQGIAQPETSQVYSEETFRINSPTVVKNVKKRPSALHMSIDSEEVDDDSTNAEIVKHYEDQLDNLVH